MAWRLAYSLETLRNQVNAKYPNRSKASDGTIGNAAHAATASDHNPNSAGVVTALDITHHDYEKPASQRYFDAHALADRLLANRHSNLKYLISNRRIAGDWTGWKWAGYSGSNPHDKHIHVSVGRGADGRSTQPYDDRTNWNIEGGEPVIRETTEEFNRYRDLFHRIRGRDPSIQEFRNAGVGLTWLRVIEILSDNPEAKQVQYWQDVGRTAVNDKWDQQIFDLQAIVKKLEAGQKLSVAEKDALKSKLNSLASELETAYNN